MISFISASSASLWIDSSASLPSPRGSEVTVANHGRDGPLNAVQIEWIATPPAAARKDADKRGARDDEGGALLAS